MTMPRESVNSNRKDAAGCPPDIEWVTQAARYFRHVSADVALLWSALTSAQEMEPRTYSAVPIGTNFVVLDYARSSGGFSFDPSLPIANAQAKINTWSIGYSHSFGIAGHTASVAVSVPYANAHVTGDVKGLPEQAYRSGLGDVRFRLAVNLLGDPALTPEEFARRSPTTIVGASVSVVAPTGQYVPSRLINVGANRWSFKPELGLSQPIGDWFVEGAAGVWLFTDNGDFFWRPAAQPRSDARLPMARRLQLAARAMDRRGRDVFHGRPDKRKWRPGPGPATQCALRCHAVGSACCAMVCEARVVAWADNTRRRQFPDRLRRAAIPLVQSLIQLAHRASPGHRQT
jgi:hypothetical protein